MKPPPLSNDAADKMLACLNHDATASDYKRAPRYFDECRKWWDKLTPRQREDALTVIDCCAGPHRKAALQIAASLPPAPRNPL